MTGKEQIIPDYILDILARRANGTILTDEEQKLEQWLDQNPEFKEESGDFTDQMEKLQLLTLKSRINTGKAREKILTSTIKKPRTRYIFPRVLPYAAIILLLIALGWYFIYFKAYDKHETKPQVTLKERHHKATLILSNGKALSLDDPDEIHLKEEGGIEITNQPGQMLEYEQETQNAEAFVMNTMVVPAGARYQLKLADGTKVWMNSVSQLEYPVAFGNDQRNVKLSGEAYFEVAEDPSTPFLIETNGYEVKVLGTSFNISTYENDHYIETTLVSGNVELTTRNGETIKLDPGHMVRVDHENQEATVEKVDTQFYTSWKDGILHFNKVTLKELMVKFERWYDVRIEFTNPEAERLVYSGAMENSKNIAFLLDLIEKTADVEFEIGENKIQVK